MAMSKKNYDAFDELFDKLNDEAFINSSVSDFTQLIKSRIDEEVKKDGYDSLEEMIYKEINASKPFESSKEPKMKKHYHCRYDYFVDALSAHQYLERHQGFYKEGHQKAISDMINLADNDPMNLCALEKIVEDQLKKASSAQKEDIYAKGYIDGLKFVKRCLLQSKLTMMEEINQALKIAIKNR